MISPERLGSLIIISVMISPERLGSLIMSTWRGGH